MPDSTGAVAPATAAIDPAKHSMRLPGGGAIWVGNQAVVLSTTLLLRERELAKLKFPIFEWEFQLMITLVPEAGAEPTIQGNIEADGLHLILGVTKNAAVLSIEDEEIGRHQSGRVATLRATITRLGTLHKVELQIRVGAP